MPRPKPVRERPRLLVDLSEKVSEDLRIDTPTSLAPAPRLQAMARPQVSSLKVGAPGVANLGTANSLGSGSKVAQRARAISKPPRALVNGLKERIRRFLPSDGETIFTLIPAEFGDLIPGRMWTNDFESYFWIAYDHHLDRCVDEWMNSEWEGINDSFYQHNVDLSYPSSGHGHTLDPSMTTLEDAWADVSMETGDKPYQVPLLDAEGIEVGTVTLRAQELMDFFGLDRSLLYPAIIMADEVLEEDFKQLEGDGEVLLDGYLIDRIERGEFTTVHLAPPK